MTAQEQIEELISTTEARQLFRRSAPTIIRRFKQLKIRQIRIFADKNMYWDRKQVMELWENGYVTTTTEQE